MPKLNNFTPPAEEVDIYRYPTDIKRQDSNEVTLGDAHGNALKMVWFLIKEGIIDMGENDYMQLVDIYTKANGDLTKEDINKFKSIVNAATVNKPTPLVRFIGDELADRGSNDFFNLIVLKKLANENVDVNINHSNHSIEFLIGFLNYKNQGGKLFYENKFAEDADGSFQRMQELLDKGVLDINDDTFNVVENEYMQRFLTPIDYALSEDGMEITIFTHAPVGDNVIEALAYRLGVAFNNATPTEYADSIDRINAAYMGYVQAGRLLELVDPDVLRLLSKDKDFAQYAIKAFPLEFMMWNRLYSDDVIKRPHEKTLAGKIYKFFRVNGHDTNRSDKTPGAICLDNALGKGKGYNKGEYQVHHANAKNRPRLNPIPPPSRPNDKKYNFKNCADYFKGGDHIKIAANEAYRLAQDANKELDRLLTSPNKHLFIVSINENSWTVIQSFILLRFELHQINEKLKQPGLSDIEKNQLMQLKDDLSSKLSEVKNILSKTNPPDSFNIDFNKALRIHRKGLFDRNVDYFLDIAKMMKADPGIIAKLEALKVGGLDESGLMMLGFQLACDAKLQNAQELYKDLTDAVAAISSYEANFTANLTTDEFLQEVKREVDEARTASPVPVIPAPASPVPASPAPARVKPLAVNPSPTTPPSPPPISPPLTKPAMPPPVSVASPVSAAQGVNTCSIDSSSTRRQEFSSKTLSNVSNAIQNLPGWELTPPTVAAGRPVFEVTVVNQKNPDTSFNISSNKIKTSSEPNVDTYIAMLECFKNLHSGEFPHIHMRSESVRGEWEQAIARVFPGHMNDVKLDVRVPTPVNPTLTSPHPVDDNPVPSTTRKR